MIVFQVASILWLSGYKLEIIINWFGKKEEFQKMYGKRDEEKRLDSRVAREKTLGGRTGLASTRRDLIVMHCGV